MNYNRYILSFLKEFKPKDLLDRLNDEEIDYWALLEIERFHKDIKVIVYFLYLEFKNKVDYQYIGTILNFEIDMKNVNYFVPESSKQIIMEYFVNRATHSSGVNTVLRTKYYACS